MSRLYAIEYDTKAHTGQKRKYTGEDYVEHPIQVSTILATLGVLDEVTLKAAVLHDVLEDCDVTKEELVEEFGIFVTDIVVSCSSWTKLNDVKLNRKLRKEIDLAFYKLNATSILGVQMSQVKMADIVHNMESIIEHDPGFAAVWLEEKVPLVDYIRSEHYDDVAICALCSAFDIHYKQFKANK